MQTNPITPEASNLAGSLAVAPPGRCMLCGDPAEPDHFMCDDCDAKAQAKNDALKRQHDRDRERRRLAWFSEKIDAEYLICDELLIPRWARDLIARWDPAERKGATINGTSRTWKTRAGIKLLEKAFVADHTIEFKQAGVLRREINQAASRGEGRDLELLRELASFEFLMIDDFGNQSSTETCEEFLLSLLERRKNSGFVTIVTTQFPSEEMIARMTNKRIGNAIANRLGPEFNWMVNSNLETVEPPKTTTTP